MIIRRIKYPDIDFIKYAECVENSAQRKYTATSLFLDVITGKNWQLLVWEDYKAVMPFYTIKKMGIEFVVTPFLCQQLGVFSREDRPQINDAFLQYLSRNFNVKSYAFNDRNQFSDKMNTRKNYILFSEDYETVYKRYSPTRRKRIKQNPDIKRESFVSEDVDFTVAEAFIRQNSKGYGDKEQVQKVIGIYKALYKAKKLHLYGFFYRDSLINLITAYEESKTIALLGTFNDASFVKLNGASVLNDEIIKRFVGHKDIDFEGSEVPSIEEFFRGFRPRLMPYPHLLNTNRDLIRIFIKRVGNFTIK